MTSTPSTNTTLRGLHITKIITAKDIAAKSIATSSLLFALITSGSLATTPMLSQNTVSAQSPITQPRPMQIDDLFQFERYADPQLSPDGSYVYFQSTKFLDPLKNQKVTNLYRLKVGSGQSDEESNQNAPVQVTRAAKADTHPRLSPDASKLLFESSRDG